MRNCFGKRATTATPIMNRRGFGLVEVLIAAGIMSVISLGVLKTFEISFNSANLMNSLYVTQDLRRVVNQSLNSGLQCENNLKSSNLISYAGAGDTRKVEVLKKYRSAGDTTGTELIRSGERFRDYLDIVAIRLEEPDTDLVFNNDVHKIFSIYYKLGRVRQFRTRDKKPCTETDTSGCYVNKCNLEYDLSDPLNPRCNLLDCFSESDKRVSVAGIRCTDSQYLSGYDSSGRAECKDLPTCGDDEYLKGYDSSGNSICELSPRNQECSAGEYLKGFDSSGNKICKILVAAPSTSPPSPPPPSSPTPIKPIIKPTNSDTHWFDTVSGKYKTCKRTAVECRNKTCRHTNCVAGRRYSGAHFSGGKWTVSNQTGNYKPFSYFYTLKTSTSRKKCHACKWTSSQCCETSRGPPTAAEIQKAKDWYKQNMREFYENNKNIW